ncbi:MAG: RdgB/HAM1 family non-canonical purine NTP pyrophosphatase [Aestuariivirgaceae bacterium]
MVLKRGDRLILASHNPGKIREISALLAPLSITVVPAGKIGLPEPEETGSTFAENALIKAKAAAGAGGLPALADDSGLAVEALSGQPGVYSARWAGPARDFVSAMRNLEEKLVSVGASAPERRRAEFICILSLCFPDGGHQEFEGRVAGRLVWPPRGTLGFGYDPMFVPDGYDMTFGEMPAHAKHGMSHRAAAFRKLYGFLEQQGLTR